ncbi:MAG TPA: CAP domain-containing protein [Candidatus Obscuribacterales bacterium]
MAKAILTALALCLLGCACPAPVCADNAMPRAYSKSETAGLRIAARPTARIRQGIFAYSNKQETSLVLGATGVPAYVASASGSRRGFYIMSVFNGGNWRRMNLQPGDLLISVDNQVITSGAQADSVLKGMTTGNRNVVFCRLDDDGRPQFTTSKASISAVEITPVANSDRLRPISHQSGQHESIEALESYAIELVNADRARNGNLPPVKSNATLNKLARDYAQYLVDHKIFAHVDDQGRDPAVRARQHGVNAGIYENLAFQQYGWGNERQMINASEKSMINEPEGQHNHRSNILGAERQYIGVGVATDGHELMLVHEFTNTDP